MNILLIFTGFIIAFVVVLYYERKIRDLSVKPKNKVHFYVTKDKDGVLILWFGKPKRAVLSELWYGYDEVNWITTMDNIRVYNLNPKDFDNLKWEDEPVEVFLNMEK